MAHVYEQRVPRVAICITGAMKMTPNTAPAMARHIQSHVVEPWSADVYAGIEIYNSLAESGFLNKYFGTLRPKRLRVYCPQTGCNANLAKWCQWPACVAGEAPKANPKWYATHWEQIKHCNEPLKKTPSFELMALKRRNCFSDILEYEQQQAADNLRYDYIYYQRPEVWHSSPRRLEELTLLSRTGGIWVNSGACNPRLTSGGASAAEVVTRVRRPASECLEEQRQIQSARQQEANGATQTPSGKAAFHRAASLRAQWAAESCTAASDHSSLIPRRWADAYFTAVNWADQVMSNKTFGCGESYGSSSGVCSCLPAKLSPGFQGMNQECMQSNWFVHNSIPWSSHPWRGTWAYGLEKDGVTVALAVSGKMPAHCVLAPEGTVFNVDAHIKHLGLVKQVARTRDPNGSYAIYRWGMEFKRPMWCNSSSPLW